MENGKIPTKGIGQRIRALRQAKGWSETQLANKMTYVLGRDFLQYSVSRVEVEFRVHLRDDELIAFAQIFGVSHLDLANIKKPMAITV